MLCPCHSNKPYAQCCEPFITGQAVPQTPEALMRSRYTAYTQANIDYIMATMHGKALQGFNKEDVQQWANSVEWVGLQVLKTSPIEKNHGTVEFIANYRLQGIPRRLHEVSEFARLNLSKEMRWYYVDGKAPKIGRNDPCPCGSGKKFKQCLCSN